MTRRCDVAIVGGGPIGATLAVALGRWPLEVTLIDPKPPGTGGADARSYALSYGSARLYRTLGLWDEVGREAAPITQVHVSRRGGLGFVRIGAAECGVEALGYVVPARTLERRLDEALDETSDSVTDASSDAGANAGTGSSSARESDSGSGSDSGGGRGTGREAPERIRATVEAVEVRRSDTVVDAVGPDGPVTVAARLVVGADGADSAVRRAAGLPLRVHRCDHVAFAGHLTPERPHRGRAFERFTERGPLAVLPLGEGRCGFVWAVPGPVAAEEGFDGPGFGARLAEMFGGRLGELREIERNVRHPLRVCHVPRITAPRTVLVGNAANALHPVGAQGFNLGLRDVEALARLLGGASASGADPASVLERYGAARRVDHAMARVLTGSLLRIYGSRLPLVPALGAAGLFALDRLGPAKRGFARLAMGADRLPGTGRMPGAGAGTELVGALRDAWSGERGGGRRAG